VRSPAIPNLDGLDDLARRNDVDVRPTLVRVLTDLYIQKSRHTAEEEQHYTELALRLIEGVDIPTRAIVARKLAHYPAAPVKVVARLARDVPEVAETILRYSARLPAAELLVIIAELGPRHAGFVAERRANDPTIRDPGGRDAGAQPASDRSGPRSRPREVSATPGQPAGVGDPPSQLSGRMGQRPGAEPPLGDVFLAANSAERRLILTNLDAEGGDGPSPSWITSGSEAIGRLESAALAHRPNVFVAELEQALGISNELARRIVTDRSGEPLLAAAKAIGMPSDVLLRVLLFLDPAIGQSVERVFDLARLYDRITPRAAVRLFASFRDGSAGRRRASTYRPVNWVEESDRIGRASSEAARRQVGTTASGSSSDKGRAPAVPASRGQDTT